MVSFLSLFTLTLATVPTLISAAPVADVAASCPDGLCARTRRKVTTEQMRKELGALLTSGSTIWGPEDPEYKDAIERYQAYMPPKIELVVRGTAEKDVVTTISYASRNSVPFYVVNRGHGLPVSQGSFNGIQIDMGLLRNITIQPDGKTAIFQGGTYDQQVIDYLWDKGYVATTGSCACVGMLGPGLGGGHGRYQGLYGLISDNMRKINVVLANGKTLTASAEENRDLFWAMQGAGHNFGAVTSFEMAIYPRLVDTWYYRTYIFRQDKLETLFTELNKLDGNGTQPAEMMNFGFYFMKPDISTTEPVIQWDFSYAGSQEDAQKYLEPFEKIGAVSVVEDNVPYTEIPSATGTGLGDPLCGKNYSHIPGTAGILVYNITTQRQLYDLYKKKIAEHPGLSGTFVVHESYGVQAVKSKAYSKSAFPLRDDNLLLQISVNYPPNSTLDAPALQWVKEAVDLWNAGQPERKPSTYVNYGLGTESLESIYGYEPWRLEKLRHMKKRYDPNNAFRYYVPIIRD